MLYPRETTRGRLVDENQMVGYREHLSRKHRIVFWTGVIGGRCSVCGGGETESHNLLMALDSISHDPIRLVITSPGGDLDSAFLFYDAMRCSQSPIETLGRYCASAAALLLAAGHKRYLYPHAKVMLHLAVGQAAGDIKDWEIQKKQMEQYQDKAISILQECGVKKSREEIMRDIDRDFWLEPDEAIAYGLADEVMTPTIMKEWLSA